MNIREGFGRVFRLITHTLGISLGCYILSIEWKYLGNDWAYGRVDDWCVLLYIILCFLFSYLVSYLTIIPVKKVFFWIVEGFTSPSSSP